MSKKKEEITPLMKNIKSETPIFILFYVFLYLRYMALFWAIYSFIHYFVSVGPPWALPIVTYTTERFTQEMSDRALKVSYYIMFCTKVDWNRDFNKDYTVKMSFLPSCDFNLSQSD